MGRATQPRKARSWACRRARSLRKAMDARPLMMGKDSAYAPGSKSSARQHTLSARKPGELVGVSS